MSRKSQLAGCLFALGLGVLVAFSAEAQNRPPKNNRREQRQQQRQQQGRDQQRASAPRGNPNRPPVTRESVVPNTNRPPERARNQQNRSPANTQPRNFSSLNPQEKQRALENNRDFQRRPPAEQQRIKRGLENWNRLTPAQQNHIKNEVLPKWRQLPPDRQRAIGSRLNVLQNMPESARNRHLDDPNFTRGMSEGDKAMLRDLAHQHVGGAPEPPNE
jgi:hypothetical protein